MTLTHSDNALTWCFVTIVTALSLSLSLSLRGFRGPPSDNVTMRRSGHVFPIYFTPNVTLPLRISRGHIGSPCRPDWRPSVRLSRPPDVGADTRFSEPSR